MRRILKVFAAVCVGFNVLFFTLFFYVLGQGFEGMETGQINDSLFYHFSAASIDAVMRPGMLLWERIPEEVRSNNALEWTLFLMVNLIYCTLITLLILSLLRFLRRKDTPTPALKSPHA